MAEAAREALGFLRADDPAWWSKTDKELGESANRDAVSARDSVIARSVADALIEMRRQRSGRQRERSDAHSVIHARATRRTP